MGTPNKPLKFITTEDGQLIDPNISEEEAEKRLNNYIENNPEVKKLVDALLNKKDDSPEIELPTNIKMLLLEKQKKNI